MSLNPNHSDHHYMNHALNLAKQGQGNVGVNPSVGCVLVKDGRVIAASHTAKNGRPHAETSALNATHNAYGATAYVTLEPCAHEGSTPSCAKELVKAKIARVVIGFIDPNPTTKGQGIQILRDAGIQVDVLKMPSHLNPHKGFFRRIERKRPFVTVKIAMSLDGKIALHNGQSQWITGDLSRRYGHVERSKHDAILTGVGTVNTDNPFFTARLGGDEIVKPIYILDPNGRMNKKAELFEKDHVKILKKTHDVNAVVGRIADDGINNLYVEAGAKVTTSFLKSGVVDRFLVFQAPKIIGAGGLSAFGDLDFTDMRDIYEMQCVQTREFGNDIMSEYRCSQG